MTFDEKLTALAARLGTTPGKLAELGVAHPGFRRALFDLMERVSDHA